ncbi:hypothetical protein HA151_06140 [Prochlorococcus marinus XMU1419]|uniref:hypothetical protein n=1 Tax=Prochlorococcus marinus TaxID=1219 RepID=UPI001ADABCAC|nr:hypothetical protein [Prochlorococcus marinus]MBO8234096.1 hypothetical protein [Prochlorococcus marinus XMU1419]MBW3077559.1 hypothetical protein [Prochlorococcus marinus str. XMU1419]
MDRYVSVKEAAELLCMSQSLLWELKNHKELVAGDHWLYVTGKLKSKVLFNVDAIRQWQIDKTKEIENTPDDIAAKKIATYRDMTA